MGVIGNVVMWLVGLRWLKESDEKAYYQGE